MANIKLQKQADTTTPNAAAEESMTDIVGALEVSIKEAVDGAYDAHLDRSDVVDSNVTFDVDFNPNKEGGTAGRYVPVKVTVLELANGEEFISRESSKTQSFDSHAKALSDCYASWPEVRLPESERIEKAISKAIATFLGKVREDVMEARQVTRAYALCDAEGGLTVNGALERIKAMDKAAVKDANESEPDAPKAVTVADDDDLLE